MAFTPKRRLGFSSLPPSPSVFQTPRSEKRPSDLRWADGNSNANVNSNHHDRDKEVSVQVVVRCRPLSDEEQKMNVQKVISCNEQKREVAVLQSLIHKQDKSYIFDKVFGPKAQQRAIYDHAISPIVNDVLEGFNCTVFAYGQTGTGKTYTMEGGMKSFKGVELSADVGVIPRAVRQIFDTLDVQKADYSMKVTFLELYNEEITDLLAPEECSRHAEDKQRRPISLMEDGKGGAVIRGLEEEVVYSASDIYNLLERGSAKRRTADTLLNKQSSRSHSIFSITIHVKEVVVGDEELIKCGRLNLVDLAGSENISRSGAREGKAREAGEINKSLLTLGRVITALVEHSGHIPYRDSKLTRLLRESLGGKAKTCIIATISPSAHCLEETLSTLDYAFRAKSIRNKPEANQKLSKSVLLKDLYLEIERMKQDVKAAREKNGVYIPADRFAQDEAEKKAMKENIEQLEVDLELKRKQANSFQELYNAEQERNLDLESEIKTCKRILENRNREFLDVQEDYRVSNLMLKEKENIISNLVLSENAILEQAKVLHSNLETTSEDVWKLHSKIDQKIKVEVKNKDLVMNFGAEVDQGLKSLHQSVISSVSQQHQLIKCMEEHASSFLARKCEETKILEVKIEKLQDIYSSGVAAMKELACALQQKSCSNIEEIKSRLATQILAVENFLVTAASEAEQTLKDIQESLIRHNQLLSCSAEQQEKELQITLLSTQMISKTATNFFNDLYTNAAKLVMSLEENQKEKSQQLENFKKMFKEASAVEEESALEKIAGILRSLKVKKENMVAEAIETINIKITEMENNTELQLLGMQQVSSEAQKEWIASIEKMESQVKEGMFSAAQTRDTMANILQDCTGKVLLSMQHWENAQKSINYLSKDNIAELDVGVGKAVQENSNLLEEFVLVSSNIALEVDDGTNSLIKCVEDTLHLDHEAKKEVEPMSAMCFHQLQLLQENHTKKISDIRDQTENLLIKEYLVDHSTGMTPKKQSINIPSLASIEALRTPPLDDLVRNMRSSGTTRGAAEDKLQQFTLPETQRSPLSTIN